uniref:Uncharacterized protein LOC100373659 n=1 Tax=Saccoglossus kowalevskii TaxID=10224 RepID=A0ABM0GN06_SACKO|nr:PREDICTED: uncharacterized protein LOC100373659 [Saccoglossus kowalevskii]
MAYHPSSVSRNKRYKDRVYGTIYGACIGNAIGTLTENMKKRQVNHKYPSKYLQSYIREALRTFRGGMTGSGCRIHDSDLMFLVVQSITECNGQIDAKDFIDRLRLLDRHGIGRTTHKVINHRLASIDPHLAAIEVWKDSGKASAPNGAVVRTSVVGIHQCNDIQEVIKNTINICKMTHADPRCVASCIAVTTGIALMLQGNEYFEINETCFDHARKYLASQKQDREMYSYMNVANCRDLHLDDEGSSYTFKCVGAGFWALRQNDFRETLITIVKEGGDADSNGAVAGALLGCKLGYSGLPQDWLEDLLLESKLSLYIERFINIGIPGITSQRYKPKETYHASSVASCLNYSGNQSIPLGQIKTCLPYRGVHGSDVDRVATHTFAANKSLLPREILLDNILGTIYGNCIGDAIGLLTEFMDKHEARHFYRDAELEYQLKERVDKHKDHQRRWKVGDWTDDSDQMILILQSLVDNSGQVNPTDFAYKLLNWTTNGFRDLGDTGGLGIGTTTYKVLSHSVFRNNPKQAAHEVWSSSGGYLAPNGAVMRTSILGIHQFEDTEMVKENTVKICETTHADPRCIASCVAVTTAIALMLQGKHLRQCGEYDVEMIVKDSFRHAKDYLKNCSYIDELQRYMNTCDIRSLRLDEPGKIGYTYKCLGAGFWALRQTDFRRALTIIVKEAGDADTNGAVAGALLGCKLGYNRLPRSWKENLRYKQWLQLKINRFE